MRSNNEELDKLLTNIAKLNSYTYKDMWEILKTKIRDRAISVARYDGLAWRLLHEVLDDMKELEKRAKE